MESVLYTKNLRKVYKTKNSSVVAFNDLSFELRKGEILGFLGPPNGSGKTVTIQMLLGTLRPTSGSIIYFGKEFSKNRCISPLFC